MQIKMNQLSTENIFFNKFHLISFCLFTSKTKTIVTKYKYLQRLVLNDDENGDHSTTLVTFPERYTYNNISRGGGILIFSCYIGSASASTVYPKNIRHIHIGQCKAPSVATANWLWLFPHWCWHIKWRKR